MRVKLVRDKVTPLGDGDDIRPVNSLAGKVGLLSLKMHEETQEVALKPWDPYEYADLWEVILEMMRMNGVSVEEVEKAAVEKRKRLGSFRRGMVLTRGAPQSAGPSPVSH